MESSDSEAPPRFGFIPLGTGDLFSHTRYPTCIMVLLGRERLLIDCPTPLPRMLHDMSIKSGVHVTLDDIHHVILTHLHGDHAGGLECLGFHVRFNASRRANLWTLPEVARDLWEHRLRASMAYEVGPDLEIRETYGLEDFFQVHRLTPGQPTQVLGATVDVRRTIHAPPCFGVKISFNGRSLGYSGDTAFDMKHIEFLQDCDVIVHETGRVIHTPYEALAGLPESIRGKMYVVHVEDSFNGDGLAIPVLQEGEFYAV
jgi:ribonuclease BN (tRNA processing enzyme)